MLNIPFYKKISLPSNLDTITVKDVADEVSPESVGLSPKRVETIWKGVKRYYGHGLHPAISICIRKRDQIVMKRSIGYLDPEDPNAIITPETPFCLFSASKACTAMLIHLLVERGLVNLTDPVVHYIPEFEGHGKEDITISHLLSHRAGISTFNGGRQKLFFSNGFKLKDICDNEAVLKRLFDSKPSTAIGRSISYHAITGGFLLGEIVRRVTGQPISVFLDENVREPLGFQNFTYGMEEKNRHKVAVNAVTGPPILFPMTVIVKRVFDGAWQEIVDLSNQAPFQQAVIPSGNIYANADELARFYQLMLNGGELDGVRIFEPLSIRRAILEACNTAADRNLMLPLRYSNAGLMLGGTPALYGHATTKAFGHVGFINSVGWADPERDITVAILASGKPFSLPSLMQFFKLIAHISKQCPRDREAPHARKSSCI